MVLVLCISLIGCADFVQTRRIVNGKETILITTKANLERIEQEDAIKQSQLDYYRGLPRRAYGDTISIFIRQTTVDPQLNQSFRRDDFMSRLIGRFEQNKQYQLTKNSYLTDLSIETHVELSKEVGVSSQGNFGEYWAIIIMGKVYNRFDPYLPYEVQVTSDILHNAEAIEEYYQKIHSLIQNELAEHLPDLTRS